MTTELLNPDMPSDELRLHMGELTPTEIRVARAAIRWANTRATPAMGPEMVAVSRKLMGMDAYFIAQKMHGQWNKDKKNDERDTEKVKRIWEVFLSVTAAPSCNQTEVNKQ